MKPDANREITVDKARFDSLLGKMLASDPQSFKEVVAKPKLRKDGNTKRSSRGEASPDVGRK